MKPPGVATYTSWLLFSLLLWLPIAMAQDAAATSKDTSVNRVLALSEGAIGNQIPPTLFLDAQGKPLDLADFQGKPLLISVIFSACVHSCSVGTRHLNRTVQVARNALGADSFTVVTLGFDYPVDRPDAMRNYAVRHGVNDPNWHFLSAQDPDSLEQLLSALGFYYEPSARGFDHSVQVSMIDANGILRRQIYGETFPTPLLVEPLKHMTLGELPPDAGLLQRVSSRVRLFCTTYDAKADRYYFDYSLFAGIFIGLLVLGSVFIWLIKEMFVRRRALAAE